MQAVAEPTRKGLKHRRWLVAGVVGLVVFVAAGPRPSFEEVWLEPTLSDDLDAWLAEREALVPDLRPGEAASIVWAGEAGATTPVSIVYLPGFSADRHEMEPVVSEVGEALGANVFFARLRGHGRGPGSLAEATVEGWLEDTAAALATAAAIGDRVVVIGTSTGGTLATWLAARPESEGRLDAVVLVSPNYRPRNRLARLPLYPWGVQVGRLVAGPEYCWEPANEEQALHWDTCYPVEAIGTMMTLVEHVRLMDKSSIDLPILVMYSPDDTVVDPAETLRIIEEMTGADVTVEVVAGSTDRSRHVLAGDILSPETNGVVREHIVDFLVEVGLVGG